MANWRALQEQLDTAVSGVFGERVRLLPMRAGGYAPRVPDPARAPLEVTGEFETLGDRAMSLMADRSGMPFQTRVAVGDIRLWVETRFVSAFDVKKGDLVEMLERSGEIYEVDRVVHTATNITLIVLIRGVTP